MERENSYGNADRYLQMLHNLKDTQDQIEILQIEQ